MRESRVIAVEKKDGMLRGPGQSFFIDFRPDDGAAIVFLHQERVAANALVEGASTTIPAKVAAAPTPVSTISAISIDSSTESTPASTDGSVVLKPTLESLGLDVPGRIDELLPEPVPPEPVPPEPLPPANPSLRVEVMRGPELQTVVKTADLAFDLSGDRRSVSFIVDGIGQRPVGVVGELWRVRVTNISEKPLQAQAVIRYKEIRTLEVTSLPLDLLNRLLLQAIHTLDLSMEIREGRAIIDMSTPAKKLISSFPARGLFIDLPSLPGVSFGNIVMTDLSAEFRNVRTTINGATFDVPAISLQLALSENTPEININLGVANFDIHISGLNLRLDLLLENRTHPNPTVGKLSGTFPLIPFIQARVVADSDIRFSSSTLGAVGTGIDRILSGIDSLVGLLTGDKIRLKSRLGTLKGHLTNLFKSEEVKDFATHILSEYVQISLQNLVNRENLFHGVRAVGDGWQVLHGPILSELPSLNPVKPLPSFDTTPIDGPQSPEDLVNLKRINHIVVLMMENRSYDHILGYLSHPDHGNDARYAGLTGQETNAIPSSDDIARPRPMPGTRFYPSPPHDLEPIVATIADGQMSGFASEFRKRFPGVGYDPASVMRFYVEGQLKTYDMLVREFAVATNWFASHPSGTWPNRMCTVSGVTIGQNNHDIEPHLGYVRNRTIFDLLTESNVKWRYYEGNLSFLRFFEKYRLNTTNLRPFELFAREFGGEQSVTFIDPSFVGLATDDVFNDDHPGGADPINGQALIAKVYNAIKLKRRDWNNTMLIVTYDEHGGFYDHVPPPGSAASPFGSVPKVISSGPAMYGVRVPTFVVSPRTQRGDILTDVYDHTSITKTIIARFLPGQESALGPRVAAARHLGAAVPLLIPRGDQVVLDDRVPVPSMAVEVDPSILKTDEFHGQLSTLGSPHRLTQQQALRLGRR